MAEIVVSAHSLRGGNFLNSSAMISSVKCGAVAFLVIASFSASVRADGNLPPVTDVCLGCICEAVSNCNLTLKCDGDTCGLFRITWAYWADGGKPTLNNQSPDASDAYSNCVIDPQCAARAIQGYMAKFGQDCNGDGVINCYDHMAIHKKGGYGCRGELPYDYTSKFNQCIDAVVKQQG